MTDSSTGSASAVVEPNRKRPCSPRSPSPGNNRGKRKEPADGGGEEEEEEEEEGEEEEEERQTFYCGVVWKWFPRRRVSLGSVRNRFLVAPEASFSHVANSTVEAGGSADVCDTK